MLRKFLVPGAVFIGLLQLFGPAQSALPQLPEVTSITKTDRLPRMTLASVSTAPLIEGPQNERRSEASGSLLPSRVEMASWLAATSRMIGIRADQRDAWSEYCFALEALLTPSRPDFRVVYSFRTNDIPDPFSRDQWLVDEFRFRGEAADRLSVAISVLRGTLTPEQKIKLAEAYGI